MILSRGLASILVLGLMLISASARAQIEARVLMLASRNLLSPANGQPVVIPTQDMVLGCYYMTRQRHGAVGEGMRFGSVEEAMSASYSALDEMVASADFVEGPRAFAEKRKPNWQGK